MVLQLKERHRICMDRGVALKGRGQGQGRGDEDGKSVGICSTSPVQASVRVPHVPRYHSLLGPGERQVVL